jgi:hypothetical protein
MGRVGFKHSPVTVLKTPILEVGGAKSGARCALEASKDPDIDKAVDAWPEIPTHIKAAIKTLVQTYKTEKG